MVGKSLYSKWKVIISCLLVIVSMTGSGAIAWAIAKHYFKQDYNYEITATVTRNVHADIKSSSYLAGDTNPYETLATKSFSGESTETTALSFSQPLNIENDEKISKFRFEITNNSPYTTMSDLIIKVDETTQDKDNIIMTWYYSPNNTNYYVYTGEYLVAHKGGKITLELRVLATTDLEQTQTISDKVSIELFSEMAPPDDFEWEYDYTYYTETNTAMRRKVCSTYKLCTHEYADELVDPSKVLVFDDSFVNANNDLNYSDINDKIVFFKLTERNVLINLGKLTNVTLVGLGSFYGSTINIAEGSSNVTFNGFMFETNTSATHVIDVKRCSNIKIVDSYFMSCDSIGDFTGVTNLLISDCSFAGSEHRTYYISSVSNLRFINNTAAQDNIQFEISATNMVISGFEGYYLPTILGSGNVYVVNNDTYTALYMPSLYSAIAHIENNSYAETTSYVHTVVAGTSTTISVTNNYSISMDKLVTTHKVKNAPDGMTFGGY